MKIIQIDKSKAAITSKFAQRVFIEYYNDLIGSKQANYMADLFLSKEAIIDLLDKGAVFKLVMDNNAIVGFYECMKETERVFLSKLYVDKDKRNMGIGRMMFDDLVKYTKDNNLTRIYLTVNKYNTPSYNIYLHLGFKVIDAVKTDIGQGYIMDDYIMEYTI